MNKDIFEALEMLEKERGIPIDFMLEKIKKAILTACKNNYNGNDDAVINIDKKKKRFEVYLMKTVCEDISDIGNEISLIDARLIDANATLGEKIGVKLDTKEFGRIAAQTARNIIRQGIRDGERGQMMKEFQSKLEQVITALVEKVDPKSGAASLKIGKAEAVLPKNERIGNEIIKEGDHIKIYVVDVKEGDKGPKAIISRTHPEMVKKLFEQEVPEIQDGIIEIKAVSREAGSRTKIAVQSFNSDVDPIGACIGPKGSRVGIIVNELRGEKIDIVEFSEDPKKFISSALAPSEVISVEIDNPEIKSCRVVVPDNQLSLAIGNKGQNARLAARLTGWKIDIRSESSLID